MKASKLITADSTPLTASSVAVREEIKVVISTSLSGEATPFTAVEIVTVVVLSAVAMFESEDTS